MGDKELARLSAGHCPLCEYRGFVLGPKAGINHNIECGNLNCRARFNVGMYAGHITFGQRIEARRDGGPMWPSEPPQ